jgi:ribonuclease-3
MSRVLAVLSELGIDLDAQFYRLAVTHRSWAYENGGVPTNERLEFLGDAVLGVVVTEHLYLSFPDEPEGILAKLRAAVVNAQSLATVARSLDLGRELLLGRGEATTGGRDKASILADTLEAVIGAVFLQHGIAAAGKFVHRLFDAVVEDAAMLGAGLDWKTSLQELSAALSLGVPTYQVTESGPDHDKRFEAYAVVSDERYGPGHGLNKKQAEQEAAASAFTDLTTLRDSQQSAVAGGVGA